MSNLEIGIALLPLGLYFGLLGISLCRSRPLVRNGAWDFAALAFGLIGFVMVGPVKLLFPVGALSVWGVFSFVMIVLLYGLVVILIGGALGLKTVVYNIREAEFSAAFSELQQKEEIQSLGNMVVIPKMRIQFSVNVLSKNRIVLLKSTSWNQNLAGWIQWEAMLREALGKVKSPFNPWGTGLLVIGFALLTVSVGCFWGGGGV